MGKIVSVAFTLVVFSSLMPVHAVTFTWSNSRPEAPTLYLDSQGNPLWGTREFAATPDLSLGALVQLWKAVGNIDDIRSMPSPESRWCDTNWSVDDELLDESHMGFLTFQDPNGSFSHTGDYALREDDILYVRAYNMSKTEIAEFGFCPDGLEIGIRNDAGEIVFHTVGGGPGGPPMQFFDNLRTEPIPEPTPLLFLVPALGVWALKRKKQSRLAPAGPA